MRTYNIMYECKNATDKCQKKKCISHVITLKNYKFDTLDS